MIKTPDQIETDNEAYWLTKTSEYPHTAVSSLEGDNAPADFPDALFRPFGRFVMVPFPVAKQIRWAFKNEASRDAFIAAVGKGLLPIKVAMETEPDPFDFL